LSGIFAGIVRGIFLSRPENFSDKMDLFQRICYVFGLLSAGIFFLSTKLYPTESFVHPHYSVASIIVYVISGFLVGFGTQLGSGCTSGHMICGIARLSKRSFVATAIFFTIPVIMAKIGTARMVNEWFSPEKSTNFTEGLQVSFPTAAYLSFLITYTAIVELFYGLVFFLGLSDRIKDGTKAHLDGYFLPFINGFIFGSGLVISGMTSPIKVIGFFDLFGPYFDPSLICVVITAIIPCTIVFQKVIIPRAAYGQKPLVHDQFHLPSPTQIDWKLVVGSAIFGIGYGLIGICPGPFITNIGSLNPIFLIFGVGVVCGMITKEKIPFFN